MIAEMMDDDAREDASEENDIATLRNMLARAMADENYTRARQYMNLIETIEGEDEMGMD
jgi:hypothetical protein